MNKVAVFIDGGHMGSLLKEFFGEPSIDYKKFADWAAGGAELLRAYYYDCLPYQSSQPTPEERERLANKQRFFNALNKIPRFQVRQGRLVYRGTGRDGKPIFEQKGTDLLLGIDLALLATKGRIGVAALVSGDYDLVPAVQVVKNEGVIVRLIHGPRGTYSEELWLEADERVEITAEVIASMLKEKTA